MHQPPQPYGYGAPPHGYPPQNYGMPGGPPPKRGMSNGLVAVIVLCCLFGGCVMCGVAGSAGKKSSTTTAAVTADPSAEASRVAAKQKSALESAIPVTSNELFAAYEANEIAADEKYKGKKLLVTGTVASIDKDAFGGLNLQLATPNMFSSTMCRMERSEKAKHMELRKGETVKLLCTGRGMILGSPSLDDCVLK